MFKILIGLMLLPVGGGKLIQACDEDTILTHIFPPDKLMK
jgi:hypothetical protein